MDRRGHKELLIRYGSAMVLTGVSLLYGAAAGRGMIYNPQEPAVMIVPVSGRATSMGNSLYCSEFEGTRYNPAYLAILPTNYYFGTYGTLARNTDFAGLYGQFKSGMNGYGIGLSSLKTGFEDFSGADDPSAGSVSVSQTLVTIAAGLRGSEYFLLGTSLKILTDTIQGDSNSGFAFDIGAGYLFNDRLRAGLVAASGIPVGNRNDAVADRMTVAVSYLPIVTLPGQRRDTDTQLALSAGRSSSGSVEYALGIEAILHDVLALRAGLERGAPSLGMGFRTRSVSIDFASSFKEQGNLHFFTLSWSPGAVAAPAPVPAQEIPAPEPAEKKKPAVSPEPARESSRARRKKVERLVQQGWDLLRADRLTEAQSRFDEALAIDPDSGPAQYGKRSVMNQLEQQQKIKNADTSLEQGNAALNRGEYITADRLFRDALSVNPSNRAAREGIDKVVNALCSKIATSLNEVPGVSLEPHVFPENEALAVSREGSVDSLARSSQFLQKKEYLKACSAWSGVKPRDGAVVQRFDPSFGTVLQREYDVSVNQAAELAQQGKYREAVTVLERIAAVQGLAPEQLSKTKGLISAYAYVGQGISATNLEEARKLIDNGSYAPAAERLKRVVRSGYQADEAENLLREIGPKLKSAPPAKKGVKAKSKKKSAVKTPKSRTAKPPEPPAGQDSDQEVEQRLKATLLQEYRSTVDQLLQEKRYEECREYLRKILYLDPQDADARRTLDRIDQMQK